METNRYRIKKVSVKSFSDGTKGFQYGFLVQVKTLFRWKSLRLFYDKYSIY